MKRIINVTPSRIGERRMIWAVVITISKGVGNKKVTHKIRTLTVWPDDILKDRQIDKKIRNMKIGESRPFSSADYKIEKVEKEHSYGMSNAVY